MVYVSTASVRTNDVAQAAFALSTSGITSIELSGGGAFDARLLEKLVRLKHEAVIDFLVHGYFPPPSEPFILNFADTGDRTRRFITGSLSFVSALDAPYYSIHAGFKKEFAFSNELLYETKGARRFSLSGIDENILWFKRAHPGMRLVIENLYPNNKNMEACFLMHIDEITSFMGARPDARLLLDLGHLYVSAALLGFDFQGAVDRLFTDYAGRIAEIHLSENHGEADDHLLLCKDSRQLGIVKEMSGIIRENGVRLTIEGRGATMKDVLKSHALVSEAIA
ncbi:MAG: hypothetical protein HY886_02850 [Deltaproteobacteria bacterium]|nr:hypothetical protein [Deltaproteobacteria bacterium]